MKTLQLDTRSFDRLVAEAARHPTRRAALRLLAGGLLAALLPARAARAAQRSDRDSDGLYDDDETNHYGTNPDVWDTDEDGASDGAEVYYGTNPLVRGAACPAGQADCGAGCIDIASDPFNCGGCGSICDLVVGPICQNGGCTGSTAPTSYCRVVGARCDSDTQCCSHGGVLCCFNGTVLDTVCTDVSGIGFVCP